MWYFYDLRSHNRRWLGRWTTTVYRVIVNFSVAHTNITSSTVRHHNKSTEAHRCLFPFLAPSGAQGVTMFVRPSGLCMSSSTDIFLSHVIIIQAPRLSASSSHFPAEHFWLRRELKESQCSSDHLFTVYWVYSSNNKCFLSRKIIWMVFTCLTKFYLSNDKILNILGTALSLSSSRITCLSSHYVHWLWSSLGAQCQGLSPESSQGL